MIDLATSQAAGVANFATGSATGDGTAIEVSLGFKPRYIKVFNLTDVVVWEKFEEFTAAQAIKTVTAGTTTLDTTSAVVIGAAGFTLLAAAFGNGKVVHWAAWS